jgi:anti-sigma B factor antagonist
MSDAALTVIEKHDHAVLVTLAVKNMDEQSTRAVQSDIERAALESPGLPFVIDLSSVKLLPSLTIGALVRMNRDFRTRGQRLMLAAVQPTVRQVLAIAKLDRLFEIHDDAAAALKAAAK